MELRPTSATVTTPVFGGEDVSTSAAGLVRYTTGARTNWHAHASGQLLVCTEGIGPVATRDGTAENLMCHYAILDETAARDATVWLEPVTDEQYAAANAGA